ncbi:MAG: hypothetical protein DMF93_01080 [Acidobacteria bacterium]|nr:MAG: hypothetical protein DMF93_01080 [Acidobacteriota bacterium]
MLSTARDTGTPSKTARPVIVPVFAESMFVTGDCVRPAAANARSARASKRAEIVMASPFAIRDSCESRIPNP